MEDRKRWLAAINHMSASSTLTLEVVCTLDLLGIFE